MIVTVTLNPAIDKSTTFVKLIPEKKLRCTEVVTEAGGGGINVSKGIKALGGESLAIFPAGGANGALLKELLGRLQISFRAVPATAATRENFNVTEQASNLQYRFVMPGGQLTSLEVQACLAAIETLDPPPAILIASGSLAPGIPEDLYAQIARLCRNKGIKCIVDSSGTPLQLAAREGVYMLKPSLSELCTLSGEELTEPGRIAAAARLIVAQGMCEVLVVSMGAAGALLVTGDLCENIPAPVVKKLSTVGAGDSMIAGIAWMLAQGKTVPEAVRFGVACGSAATMNAGSALFKPEDVFKLYEWQLNQSAAITSAL